MQILSRFWNRAAAFAVVLLVCFVYVDGSHAQQTNHALGQEVNSVTKILIRTNKEEIVATLDDNAAGRDFLSLLPLTLTLKDYANMEKVSDLPKRLSIDGAPEGYDPSVGDITYYAPWGNLAIFYRDFGYARGLVRIGQLDGDVGALMRSGSFAVTIEKVE